MNKYGYVYISVSSVALFSVIFCFAIVLFNNENSCQMTYMYQYPQFVKVPVDCNISSDYEKYTLYAYGEGTRFESVKLYNFTGIPVLFIPGHAGSFKQVRSIASMCQRKVSPFNLSFHFDFFTVDLNNEYSGLYGVILNDQSKFVAASIKNILELYNGNYKQNSVIVIGHSMGGLLVRGIFRLIDFNPEHIRLIITLATPHMPVILIDHDMNSYYNTVDSFWNKVKSVDSWETQNLTMVSIGGGFKDFQVRPGLHNSKFADINVVTTAIPGVGVSMDHLCILWCKSLLEVLVRTMFDSIDPSTRSVIEDKSTLTNVLIYHLIKRTDNRFYATHQKKVLLNELSFFDELEIDPGTLEMQHGVAMHTTLLIKLTDKLANKHFFIRATNVQTKDWIGICKAKVYGGTNRSQCATMINLSKKTTGFDKDFNVKYVDLYLDEVVKQGFTHIVIQITPTEDLVAFSFDTYEEKERVFNQTEWHNPKTGISLKTEKNNLFYNVKLPNYGLWEVHLATLRSFNCTSSESDSIAVLHYSVPWSHEDSHAIIRSNSTGNLIIFVQNKKPDNRTDEQPQLNLYLDPKCTYSLSIGISVSHTIVLIGEKFGTSLIAYVVTVLLLTLAERYITKSTSTSVNNVFVIRPKRIVTCFCFTNCIGYVLKNCGFIHNLMNMSDMDKKYDIEMLSEKKEAMDSYMIPLGFYLLSYAIVSLSILLLHLLTHVGKRLIHTTHFWKVMKILTGNAQHDIGAGVTVDLFAVLFYLISWKTCSGFFVLLGAIYYFLRLCWLKWLHANWTMWFMRRNDIRVPDRVQIVQMKETVNIHELLFLLWCVYLLLSLPSIVTWFENLRYGITLHCDNSRAVTLIMALITSVVWPITNLPTRKTNYILFIAIPLNFYSWYTMLFAQIKVYRILHVINGAFTLVAAHYIVFNRDYSVKMAVQIEGNFPLPRRQLYHE